MVRAKLRWHREDWVKYALNRADYATSLVPSLGLLGSTHIPGDRHRIRPVIGGSPSRLPASSNIWVCMGQPGSGPSICGARYALEYGGGQATGFLDGRDRAPGRRGDERRLGLGQEPNLRSGGNGEDHDPRCGGGGHHGSPVRHADRPGPHGAVNRPTADYPPTGFRGSAALDPLSQRMTQVLDQLSVDAHLAATVRTGLDVGQVRPGARPELFAEGKVFQQLATCPATAH